MEPALSEILAALITDINGINDRITKLRRDCNDSAIARPLAVTGTKLDEARHWTSDALAVAVAREE